VVGIEAMVEIAREENQLVAMANSITMINSASCTQPVNIQYVMCAYLCTPLYSFTHTICK
jgi:hypothetical protein